MMDSFGGLSVRSFLRAILTLVLLLGGGVGDRAPVQAPEQVSCCCGTPANMPDSCPCPKPDGNRGPSQSLCSNRATTATAAASQRTQAERRTEPRPEPATWAKAAEVTDKGGFSPQVQGRDPDLSRHLARLNTFLI